MSSENQRAAVHARAQSLASAQGRKVGPGSKSGARGPLRLFLPPPPFKARRARQPRASHAHTLHFHFVEYDLSVSAQIDGPEPDPEAPRARRSRPASAHVLRRGRNAGYAWVTHAALQTDASRPRRPRARATTQTHFVLSAICPPRFNAPTHCNCTVALGATSRCVYSALRQYGFTRISPPCVRGPRILGKPA